MSQWESLLGLAARARKVTMGEEFVLKDVRAGRAKLVILAGDAGASTKKRVTDKCTSYQVPLIEVSDRYTIGAALGKDMRVVVSVTESGFANKLKQLLS
ncbi:MULTISPECIES: YlxQ family RNA-binding protein [unclassified Exiguobacterium]|uniref:YlxQ family RNA-binding protein n=1 Tax=unclassified Exiguobacterium TaxID=2644629 RepID=UPI001BEB1E3C|nr:MULTISPECIES: YlxQ family RNA-binding protein [unclassified Exiguobacterium]